MPETITITDDRSGKTVTVPIEGGVFSSAALRELDPTLYMFDPAYLSTAATQGEQAVGFQEALTALHGVHVVAGLIPMAVTTRRAYAGRYSAERHEGVTMCAMYWHFLDAVWLIIFCNLVFVG